MFIRFHHKTVQIFSSLTPAMILLFCALLQLFLGCLDFFTGDYSLIVFYLVPVSLAAWFVSKRSGLLFCLLAIVSRILVGDGSSAPLFTTHPAHYYWNIVIELVFLVIMSLLFSTLKNTLENEKELSRRDPLTNTLNRRSFFDLAEHEIHRSQRYALPMTVAYIDIDNFKLVNDQFGHQAGDKLLIATVSTIRSNVRSSDILARFGGDEFVLLLPDTPGDAGVKLLNKTRDYLDQAMARNGWPVTFSIGAVTYFRVPPTVDEVIHYADELMYSVKHGGKNRLVHEEILEVKNG